MNLYQYFENFSQLKINKTVRIVLLVVYAAIMFISIQSQINTLIFIILFVVLPIAIYALVKMIFPKT